MRDAARRPRRLPSAATFKEWPPNHPLPFRDVVAAESFSRGGRMAINAALWVLKVATTDGAALARAGRALAALLTG